jgi:ParB-like chromosome segregation protein Spo0J
VELVENLQRRELSDEEEAGAFITLVRDKGHVMVGVADAVGRSVAYISKRIRVFENAAMRRSIEQGRRLERARRSRGDPSTATGPCRREGAVDARGKRGAVAGGAHRRDARRGPTGGSFRAADQAPPSQSNARRTCPCAFAS